MTIYKPAMMKITSIREEAPLVRTFQMAFVDPEEQARFKATYRTGMFGMYGVFGQGECAFCIANPETRNDYVECTFRQSGRATSALAGCDVGDVVGFRGPYGNRFPLEKFEGKNLVFVAGGIGLPPTRSVIWSCLDQRERYGKITIVYGARTVADLVYKQELEAWGERKDVKVILTVDPGGETADWGHKVGFVPTVLEESQVPSKKGVAVVCGPPIMIKFSLVSLEKMGFGLDRIYTTLENRMKCGVGKCGRCNIGSTYVCKEGPVFTAEQLLQLPSSDF